MRCCWDSMQTSENFLSELLVRFHGTWTCIFNLLLLLFNLNVLWDPLWTFLGHTLWSTFVFFSSWFLAVTFQKWSVSQKQSSNRWYGHASTWKMIARSYHCPQNEVKRGLRYCTARSRHKITPLPALMLHELPPIWILKPGPIFRRQTRDCMSRVTVKLLFRLSPANICVWHRKIDSGGGAQVTVTFWKVFYHSMYPSTIENIDFCESYSELPG